MVSNNNNMKYSKLSQRKPRAKILNDVVEVFEKVCGWIHSKVCIEGYMVIRVMWRSKERVALF